MNLKIIPIPVHKREHNFSHEPISPDTRIRIILRHVQSTTIERFLLMATTTMVVLNANLPTLQGVSSSFIFFGILLVYQVLRRPGILFQTAQHPVFLAGYTFIGLSLIIEIMHENSAFYGIFQIGFMLVGAVLVSSLCRDRRAFYSGLYGYILGCIILTVIVVLTTYGKISSATVTGNFSSASGLRFNAFSDNPLQDNIGGMAFFASQGALLTLILVLNSTKCLQRFVLLGISVLCMVGLFITMSRSGLTDFVLASAAVFYTYGIMRPRVIIIATVIILAVIVLVPPAVFSRLSITTEAEGDSRTPIYLEVIERIPEYILTGVGMGNFYSEWGKQTKFGGKTVGGVHNCVAQVTINWGLIGLIVFLRLIWQAYQCFPRRGGTDSLRLSLLAISVATLAATMFSHNLEDKIFSVALGFLAAADLWIWPQSIARLASWIAVRRISEQH